MIIRVLTAAPVGLSVTMALLFAMHLLIESSSEPLTPRAVDDFPIWLAEVPKLEPPLVEDLPPLPDAPLPPSTPPPVDFDLADGHVTATVTLPMPHAVSAEGARLFDHYGDGPLVQWVLVQPVYPESAKRRGLEGFVTVSFDVTATGHTENITIVEATSSVFEKAAIRAARKFRFKPKFVDGTPLPTLGVRYRFRFQLDD